MATAPAAVAPRRMRFIGFLFHRDVGFWRYVVRATAVGLVGVIAIGALGDAIVTLAGGDSSYGSSVEFTTWQDVLGIVVIAPLVETLLLAAMLAILKPIPSRGRRAIVSGLLWGSVHIVARENPVGIATAWSFFVMSWTWLTWREVSLWRAYAATLLVHALGNGVLVAVVTLAARLLAALDAPGMR